MSSRLPLEAEKPPPGTDGWAGRSNTCQMYSTDNMEGESYYSNASITGGTAYYTHTHTQSHTYTHKHTSTLKHTLAENSRPRCWRTSKQRAVCVCVCMYVYVCVCVLECESV